MPKVSVRVALSGLLVLVLLVTISVVGISSYLNARFAVQQLTGRVMEQASERIDLHIQHALDLAHSEADTAAGLVEAGVLSADDHDGMMEYFLQALEQSPALTYLSFTTATGDYWHAKRDDRGELTTYRIANLPDGSQELFQYEVGDEGRREVTLHAEGTFDQIHRPYFVDARSAGRAVWTETYLFLSVTAVVNVPGVTRAVPTYQDGELTGVITADYNLHRLSHFLGLIDMGERGFSFVIELRQDGQRYVIAHRDPNLVAVPDVEAGLSDGQRITIATVDDPILRTFGAQLPHDLDLVGTDGFVPLDFEHQGQRFLAGYRMVGGEERPAWLIGLALPEEDVMGPVSRMNRVTLLVALGGVLVALLLGLWFARSLTRAIRVHREDLVRIARFDIDGDQGTRHSTILELDDMAEAAQSMKEGLRSFGRYVPTGLVRQLVRSGGEATLGAEIRELTVLFTDIAGFTPIVESTPPQQVLDALGEYLDGMNLEIAEQGGTVCQYLGDAIMAFWGAPVEQPDHALRACRGALAMRMWTRQLVAEAPGKGLPALPTRFGINTGDVMVGNIGARERFNYACLGDPVNTAARLEGLNKAYGTQLLVGERTAELVGDDMVFRPLDWVRMKGKAKPMLVHELVGSPEEVTAEERRTIQRYRDGLDAYRERRFAEAIRHFQEVGDSPSAVMIARCEAYLEQPPPEDWDGVFVMTTK